MRGLASITIRTLSLMILLSSLLELRILSGKPSDMAVQSHIKQLISEALEQSYPPSEYRFEIALKRIPKSVDQLEADDIEGIRFNASTAPKGYERVELITQDPVFSNRISNRVQVHIQLWQKLPIMRNSMKEGERIGSQDIHYQWLDITRLTGPFITQIEEIPANQVLARLLQKGSPIRINDFKREAVVFAGEPIIMIMEQSGYRIEILCTARQDGAIGEEIRCYSADNRKTYSVEILDKGTTRWKHTY